MLRQIVSPLGALFTLEFPNDIELLLDDAEEQERLKRIQYMQRIAGGDADANDTTQQRNTSPERSN